MKNIFQNLLDKYLLEKITKEETTQFFSMLNEPEYQDLLKENIGKDFLESTYTDREDLARRERIKEKLKILKATDKIPARILNIRRWAAAASVVLLLSTGGYLLFSEKSIQQTAKTETPHPFKNDVVPGGNKAVLTLADGRQIILDSTAAGTLTQQGNTKIIKLDDGQIAYNGIGTEVLYNTITTPKGGQYQIVLSDGSKVWLNAASSLRFPASFTGKERNVELTGEGYFEIAKNIAKPFHVKVKDMKVEVLGTHFNVNAYEDENMIRTTLLEGSVKVVKNSNSKIIKPGQQAVFTDEFSVVPVDVAEVIAWKNGKFQFSEGADIATVMRQIARWYDVDVEYRGKITGHIGGTISRNVNASQVFKMLELTGSVKFKIDGKKVIVMQ